MSDARFNEGSIRPLLVNPIIKKWFKHKQVLTYPDSEKIGDSIGRR